MKVISQACTVVLTTSAFWWYVKREEERKRGGWRGAVPLSSALLASFPVEL